jgi:1,4-dihydroxy-2-naphthoate octaprenyltransferase
MNSTTPPWIEAMRLRTLPVSIAGVVMAAALALRAHTFKPLPVVICVFFALLAQIASNFANEYFDYRNGFDRKGRVGPRRGVTEGDITPCAMLVATIATLALAALLGCSLIYWGGWWLIAAGMAIIAGALAYSTGPYPLARKGWGEVAVVLFFGVVPVTLTYYIQAGNCPVEVWLTSIATGLLGANVLVVNNYRDIDDDRVSGKQTLAVRFGRRFAAALYVGNGLVAVGLMYKLWLQMPQFLLFPTLYLLLHLFNWIRICRLTGSRLNPLLGQTAMAMLLYTVLFLIACVSA